MARADHERARVLYLVSLWYASTTGGLHNALALGTLVARWTLVRSVGRLDSCVGVCVWCLVGGSCRRCPRVVWTLGTWVEVPLGLWFAYARFRCSLERLDTP